MEGGGGVVEEGEAPSPSSHGVRPFYYITWGGLHTQYEGQPSTHPLHDSPAGRGASLLMNTGLGIGIDASPPVQGPSPSLSPAALLGGRGGGGLLPLPMSAPPPPPALGRGLSGSGPNHWGRGEGQNEKGRRPPHHRTSPPRAVTRDPPTPHGGGGAQVKRHAHTHPLPQHEGKGDPVPFGAGNTAPPLNTPHQKEASPPPAMGHRGVCPGPSGTEQ